MNIKFVLKGSKGAVQLLLGTDWYLPSTIKEYRDEGINSRPAPVHLRRDEKFLKGWDIGYHSPTPRYEGQEPLHCEFIGGKDCYYDSSSLNAERFPDILLKEGDEGIWRELEEYYKQTFGDEE